MPTARTASAQESLGGIDAYVTELKEAMASLDGEILQTVREQTGAGSSARRDLESGKAAMLELFGKVYADGHPHGCSRVGPPAPHPRGPSSAFVRSR